jgi:hypothetical protein
MARCRGSVVRCGSLLSISVLLSGCSLILDFDDPAGPIDAAMPDAIDDGACAFGEPNESRAEAHVLAPVDGQVAGICDEGDRDVYALDVADGQTLVFEIRFRQAGSHGDLDLRLLDDLGTIVARSLSTDDDERIACPGTAPDCPQLAAGRYYAEVFGFSPSVRNAYTIHYALTGP